MDVPGNTQLAGANPIYFANLESRSALDVQASAIAGTRQVLAPASIHVHGGRVRLIVGDPIPILGITARERKKLAARVRNDIKEMLLKSTVTN